MNRTARSILSFLLCATGSILFAQQPAQSKPVDPAVAKQLHDALETRNLDQIDLGQAQATVMQRNPLAKRANETLMRIVNSDDEVKKSQTQLDADQKKLVDEVKKDCNTSGPDGSWDFDFNQNLCVQTKKPEAKPAPAKPEPAKTVPLPPTK
jgi:hypothetical protein